MSEAFPVFIGITGKRELASVPAAAAALEHELRARLKATFDYVEDLLPSTPKILLTGGAVGVDLIAAEEVLGLADDQKDRRTRRNWLVVVALPFARELFEQDFKPDQWAKFVRVADDPRTRTIVLPPLQSATGGPAAAADLQRRADATEAQKDLRRRHYEQVGLWIADTANVLLAVLPTGEAAHSIGGTARIVACRRSTRPDSIAAEVISASSVLAPRTELYRAPNGYVWLVDPAAAPLCATPPVTVLPPAADGTPSDAVYRAPAVVDYLSEDSAESEGPFQRHPTQADYLEESCRVLKIARGYARDNAAKPEPTAVLQAWPPPQDRANLLMQISNALRKPTNDAAEEYRRTIYVLGGLFAIAVLTFESYAKFLSDNWVALLVYLAVLGTIMVIYWKAGRDELQPIAEDRRAIREALRAQAAWWQAGLDDRVDFIYLRGADQDLARVRQATRNVIAYSLLAGEKSSGKPDWSPVTDWINGQYKYFRDRKAQRHTRGEFVEATSWSLFVTAAFLAGLLCVWLGSSEVEGDLDYCLTKMDYLSYWFTISAAVVMVAATAGCWWLGLKVSAERESKWLPTAIYLPAAFCLFIAVHFAAMIVNHSNEPLRYYGLVPLILTGVAMFFLWKIVLDANTTRPVATIMTVAIIIVLSLAVMAGAALHSSHVDNAEKVIARIAAVLQSGDRPEAVIARATAALPKLGLDKAEDVVARYMTIVLVVFLPTLAGALRFLSEKLAVEAEALSYRDAYVWFKHAMDLLKAQPPGKGDAAADARAQDIVKRLGTLAILENEGWLKLRRERPLSPVI
jgi:hypothetical protein